MKAPAPTVKTMKYVFDRHLSPLGGFELWKLGGLSMVDLDLRCGVVEN